MSRRVLWRALATAVLALSIGCEGAVVGPGGESTPLSGDGWSASDSGDEADASSPTNFHITSQGRTTIDVGWGAPKVGSASAYAVYLDGASVDTVTGRSFQFSDLRCGTTYTLQVEAQGNNGSVSARVSARGTTSACAGGTTTTPPPTPADAGMAPTTGTGTTPVVTTPPVPGAFINGVCAYNGTNDFARIQSLGIKAVRMDRPSASLIEKARTFGIEVLPIADYGFTDLSGSGDMQVPPTPQNYGAWSKRMVDTWRGMKDPPKVLEVWNEPWGVFWKPKPDPVAYLALCKAFAAEAWSVWPTATILVSADESSAQYGTWRKDLIAADSGGFLKDPRVLPTTHNYAEARTPTQVTKSPCAWDLNRFQCAYNDFKKHGHPNPQVWITEYGWESNTPSPGYAMYGAVSEQQQSDYTIQALDIFRKSGMVAAAYSYMVRSNEPWNYNWLRPDNSDKPIVGAIKAYLKANP